MGESFATPAGPTGGLGGRTTGAIGLTGAGVTTGVVGGGTEATPGVGLTDAGATGGTVGGRTEATPSAVGGVQVRRVP